MAISTIIALVFALRNKSEKQIGYSKEELKTIKETLIDVKKFYQNVEELTKVLNILSNQGTQIDNLEKRVEKLEKPK